MIPCINPCVTKSTKNPAKLGLGCCWEYSRRVLFSGYIGWGCGGRMPGYVCKYRGMHPGIPGHIYAWGSLLASPRCFTKFVAFVHEAFSVPSSLFPAQQPAVIGRRRSVLVILVFCGLISCESHLWAPARGGAIP